MLKAYLRYVEERGYTKIPARQRIPEGREISGPKGERILVWPKSINHNFQIKIKGPQKLADYAPLYEAVNLPPAYNFCYESLDLSNVTHVAPNNRLDFFRVGDVEIHRDKIISTKDDETVYYPFALNRAALALYDKAPKPPPNLSKFFDSLLEEDLVKNLRTIRCKAKSLYLAFIPNTSDVGIFIEKTKEIKIDPSERVHPVFDETDMKTTDPNDRVNPADIFNC